MSLLGLHGYKITQTTKELEKDHLRFTHLSISTGWGYGLVQWWTVWRTCCTTAVNCKPKYQKMIRITQTFATYYMQGGELSVQSQHCFKQLKSIHSSYATHFLLSSHTRSWNCKGERVIYLSQPMCTTRIMAGRGSNTICLTCWSQTLPSPPHQKCKLFKKLHHSYTALFHFFINCKKCKCKITITQSNISDSYHIQSKSTWIIMWGRHL